jgi:ADP-ribose pyrophosphatase YjhB (NUDIX family)
MVVQMIVPKHRTGVAFVAFDDEDRILMLKHVFHPGAPWGIPGGWLAKGESPAECALRELKEETGLIGELGGAVYLSHEPIPPHIGIAFSGRVQPGPISLSDEIIEARWFQQSELPRPLMPFVEHAIQQAINSRHDGIHQMRHPDHE